MQQDWESQFGQVFRRGSAAWKEGRTSPRTMFSPEDVSFLATIGCTAQELFDFVDDFHRYGEPDYDTALAVAAIRREYFLKVLKGKSTGKTVSMDELPAKATEVDGIAWLPRLIAKARLKLRGEMPDDLMFGCGGDRAFIEEYKVTLPQVLQLAWDAGDDDRRIIDTIKKAAGRK